MKIAFHYLFVITLKFYDLRFVTSSCPSTIQQSVFVITRNKKSNSTIVETLRNVARDNDCEFQCVKRFECYSYDYKDEDKLCEINSNEGEIIPVDNNGWIHGQKKLLPVDDYTTQTTPTETRQYSLSMNISKEFEITKKNNISTMPIVSNEWELSLQLKINGKSFSGSVLHFTVFKFNKKHTNRMLSLRRKKSNALSIKSSINGNKNYTFIIKPLHTGQFHNIKLEQIKKGGKFQYSIFINDTKVHTVENTDAQRFENVTVYAGKSKNIAQNCIIKNLLFMQYL